MNGYLSNHFLYNSENKLSGFKIYDVSKIIKKQKSNCYISVEEALVKLKNFLDGNTIYYNIQNHYELFTKMDERKNTKVNITKN